MTPEKILEIIGVTVGILYIWLEYRASVWLWLTGIIMPAIYIYVYYAAGFYADVGINVYYLFAGLWGWAVWVGKSGTKKTRRGVSEPVPDDTTAKNVQLSISRTPLRLILPLLLISVAFFIVIAWILINFTDSTVPYGDSLTTALSFVALWMLARKYAEQWLVWIVVDVICCGLYLYKGLDFTATLYGLYAVIAIFGYRKWLRMMNEQENEKRV